MQLSCVVIVARILLQQDKLGPSLFSLNGGIFSNIDDSGVLQAIWKEDVTTQLIYSDIKFLLFPVY